ncbi:transcription-repair coupling factor, partial [bacterium]|nr:transcription-repair coupling factor [bacterium]
LTLTATPIPRTLHMSLMGIRDLSVINTPPEDRLAVRTFLTRWDDDSLREAIHRELARGGSVFFIHNRIEGIDVIAEKVRRLAPEARVRVGHGKMHGDQIEELLIDFAEHRYDILVATTIVGSGLDFPQANTMIINRADNLGLAQLYQLRGRVGRSKVRAYCYLVIPEGANVSQDARKRLAAIKTFTDLGSGYKIAAKDMEIRGAGNLLGAEQSGQIAMIGYELYRELLDDEIARLKGEVVEEKIDTEINLPLPAFIPEDYVPEASVRLATYKRIADAGDPDALGAIRDELLDRFGEIPLEVGNLLTVMRIKITAQPLRVTGIDYSGENLVFAFHESTPVTASALVAMVTADASRFRLLPDGRLMEKVGRLRPESVPDAVQSGLNALSMCVRNRRSSDNLGNASGSEVEI